jgi:phage/plasmid primase, P4 family, C-terminal domain
VKLLDHHREGLRARGLTDATIEAAGIFSETNKDKLAAALNWKRASKTIAPAIGIPFHGPDGVNGYVRYRPDIPRLDRNDKPIKYESRRGEPNRVYFPPGTFDCLQNAAQELALVEGEFKSLALTQELLPTLGLVGVYGWKAKDHQRLLPELEKIAWSGRTVYIVFDSDYATNENVVTALAWLAKHLTDRGAKPRFVRLPDKPDGSKQGIDDFIAAKGTDAKREVRALLDAAEDPPAVKPEQLREPASAADPAKEAAAILAAEQKDGVSKLRYWRDTFEHWRAGRYVEVKSSEIAARVVQHLNRVYTHVGTTVVSNVVLQLKGQSLLAGDVTAPAWLTRVDGCEGWRTADLFVARNGILYLPTKRFIPPTPRLFTPAALDFDYEPKGPEPAHWLKFLSQLWPDDADSVLTLQQWFGLCLVADTRHQKMLLIVGPKRSGKGTVARVLRAVVGAWNCAGPTMASLATNFGLWPLWGKTVAIISDARLSGRTDQAVITERLLSITGEDALTIDRKHQEPVTDKLLTRLLILTNELPRLGDSSGALSGRMLILRLVRSFYGEEDIGLTDRLLAERAGILRWAIQGWHSLREVGYFVQPASGLDLHEQMDELASPVMSFAGERCIVDADELLHRVSCQSLYTAWCAWSIAKGLKPTSDATFGRDLTAAFPQIRRFRPRENDCRIWTYAGIGLLANEAEEFA